MDEPAEPIPPDDLSGRADGVPAGKWRAQVERSVRSGHVVVLDELPQDGLQVARTEEATEAARWPTFQ